MTRNIFDQDHDLFRDCVRKFIEQEVDPISKSFADAGIQDHLRGTTEIIGRDLGL
jgi:hypothetical protein